MSNLGAQTFQLEITDILDLHAFSPKEIPVAVEAYLEEARRRGFTTVRIIHGKGLGSKNGEPVLKRKVSGWLMRRDEILAFCQARRTEGGGGAAVVLLKSRRA